MKAKEFKSQPQA